MSATMTSAVTGIFQRPRVIRGVCADLAARAGTAIWLPRAAFLLLGVLHWFLAIVLYVILAKTVCSARSAFAARATFVPAAEPGIRSRLSALDQRLASMEAATLQQETSLRRQFRDLERN